MRLAVYTDYVYWRDGDELYAERAFALFLASVAEHFDNLVLVGRLSPKPERTHYRLPPGIELVALPHHAGLRASPSSTARALAGSIKPVWDVLPRVDAVWLLGPHPLVPIFGALATLRGRRFVLGVRQDTPRYVRSRHPRARAVWWTGDVLDRINLALARHAPTVVVGPELARRYHRARELLPIVVSLVSADDIVAFDQAVARSYARDLRALCVGRIETEKNPLLLADIAARLRTEGTPWHLHVCGEGPLRHALECRLEALDVATRVELAGYVPLGPELFKLYRGAHALLHVSWTEGVPQVLYEAMAAGLPIVATDVGGVAEAVRDAALLIPAGDADAAAQALKRISVEPDLRARLIERGLAIVRRHTVDVEAQRVAQFVTRALATTTDVT